MARHTIKYRDWSRGDEPRRIVWDDEAGEVSGDHVEVPSIQAYLADAVRDGRLADDWGSVALRDPRHDPAEFLTVLLWAVGGTFRYAEVDLPPSLRGIETIRGVARPLPPGVVT